MSNFNSPPLWDPADLVRRRQRQELNRRFGLHLMLFILTFFSTTLAGMSIKDNWLGGLSYSIPLMSILLLHEMGHYVAAKYYGVKASLPYFMPFPSLFGTFGAVIRMEGIIPHRKALFDIGIMGPLMGVIVALPAMVIGLKLSAVQVIPLDNAPGYLKLGDSLLLKWLSYWLHGPLPTGSELFLHPLGFAGWAGLFVTALNLMPMGQLDGGHIVYAMLREKSLWFYRAVFGAFALLAILIDRQWLFFLVLTLFLIRLKHPPTLDDDQPLGRGRVVAGIAAILFLILTFPPIPIGFTK